MKKTKRPTTSEIKRGRPAKYGRPSQLVAITLPEDVIATLLNRNPDLGWAIVNLVEPLASAAGTTAPDPVPSVQLAYLSKKRALLVVNEPVVRNVSGVTCVPLTDGRAFLAFDRPSGLADLELAVVDRIESLPPHSAEFSALTQVRETLRAWRKDKRLTFVSKSIIVVEGSDETASSRLPALRNGG